MTKEKKAKRSFQMPPLLFLMLGLLIFMSILTYIIPAGQFAVDANGAIIPDQFSFVERTPVNPLRAVAAIAQGFVNNSSLIVMFLAAGGAVSVILSTQAVDHVIDWALYKLQNKGPYVLIILMFCMMSALGAFAGSDMLIGFIPVGVLFAKKMKADPIVAAALTVLPALIGFATSPMQVYFAQSLMDVTMFSGWGVRMTNLIVCTLLCAIYVALYARRVIKDPAKSLMGSSEWTKSLEAGDALEVKTLNPKDLIITVLFFLQYFVGVYCMMTFQWDYGAFIVIFFVVSIFCGLLAGFDMAKISSVYAAGAGGMAMLSVVSGMAGALSIVMQEGQILHTITYYACLPLRNLSSGIAAVGISVVLMLVNILVPGAMTKMMVFLPVVRPMTSVLGFSGQVGVQAFQIGDGFTNVVSPFEPLVQGGLDIVHAPYNKWLKFAVPLIAVMLVLQWIMLYVLTMLAWA